MRRLDVDSAAAAAATAASTRGSLPQQQRNQTSMKSLIIADKIAPEIILSFFAAGSIIFVCVSVCDNGMPAQMLLMF